jgi:hypothetical protein
MRRREPGPPRDDELFIEGALIDPEARRDLAALTARRRQLQSRTGPSASNGSGRRLRRRPPETVQVTLNVRAVIFAAVLSALVAALAWSFSWEWSYHWITRIFEALSLALVFMGVRQIRA